MFDYDYKISKLDSDDYDGVKFIVKVYTMIKDFHITAGAPVLNYSQQRVTSNLNDN